MILFVKLFENQPHRLEKYCKYLIHDFYTSNGMYGFFSYIRIKRKFIPLMFNIQFW